MGITRKLLSFETHFTKIPNQWARDDRLSRRARGLLVELASHRPGWHVSTRSLARPGFEGKDAVAATLTELVKAGYLEAVQSRGKGGRFAEIEYTLVDPWAVLDSDQDGKSVTEGSEVPDYDRDVTVSGKSGHGGFTVSGSAVSGLAVSGKSAHKEDYSLEDHLEEEQAPKGATRATRIPDQFIVTASMREWAATEVPGVDVDRSTRMFVDYWRGVAGVKATKRDWPATWRNWLRRDHERLPKSRPSRAEDAFALAEKYEAQERGELIA